VVGKYVVRLSYSASAHSPRRTYLLGGGEAVTARIYLLGFLEILENNGYSIYASVDQNMGVSRAYFAFRSSADVAFSADLWKQQQRKSHLFVAVFSQTHNWFCLQSGSSGTDTWICRRSRDWQPGHAVYANFV
jgi:hypothetical protein